MATLFDKRVMQVNNHAMIPPHAQLVRQLLQAALILGVALVGATGASAAPPLEYCAHRPSDQQLRAAPSREHQDGPSRTDCTPFTERTTPRKTDNPDGRDPDRPSRELKLENLQQEVSTFLHEYRRFLDCCKTDPAELEGIEALGDYVDDLLRTAQHQLFSEQMKLRGMTVKEMLAPVAAARRELRLLHAQLRELGILMEKRDAEEADGTTGGTMTNQTTEDALQQQPRPPSLPTGAKTGVEIGVTPLAGRDIGKTPRSGTGIGAEGLTGPSIGATPKTGQEIGATGPTGFEIGATGRAGPGIGESPFNTDGSSSVGSTLHPSTIGSSLGDSTVGSTIGGSTMGSSMTDSSVGSTIGGSSVGSSLQNRSTGP